MKIRADSIFWSQPFVVVIRSSFLTNTPLAGRQAFEAYVEALRSYLNL